MARPKRSLKQTHHAPPVSGETRYRLRAGQTGLDPLDNAREASYIEGKAIRHLLTGRLASPRLANIIVMAISGMGLLMPVVFCTLITPHQFLGADFGDTWACFAVPLTVAGVAFGMNVFLSLRLRRRRDKRQQS